MSNLAIVLCVALCVSAGNAFSWAESMKSAQENVQKMTDEVITKIHDEFVANQLSTHKEAKELQKKTDEFTSKIDLETKTVVENVNNAIDESIDKAEAGHVNVDDCKHSDDSKTLDDLAKAVKDIAKTCVKTKIDTLLGYLEEISDVADKVIVETEEARETNQHCGDNVEDAKSALAGILCSKKSAATATWTSLKAAPQLTLAWSKVKLLNVSIQPALSLCTKNERLALFKEAVVIRTRSELCIQKKIAEAEEVPTESH